MKMTKPVLSKPGPKAVAPATTTKTSADARAVVERLAQKGAGIADQIDAMLAERTRLKADKKAALYAARVDDDPRGAERARACDAAIEQVERELENLEDVSEQLTATMDAEKAHEATLAEQEQQAHVDRELTKHEQLAAETDKAAAIFAGLLGRFAASDVSVTRLCSLPGSRTVESIVAEAIYSHTRAVLPGLLREAPSIPSQARNFSAWAHSGPGDARSGRHSPRRPEAAGLLTCAATAETPRRATRARRPARDLSLPSARVRVARDPPRAPARRPLQPPSSRSEKPSMSIWAPRMGHDCRIARDKASAGSDTASRRRQLVLRARRIRVRHRSDPRARAITRPPRCRRPRRHSTPRMQTHFGARLGPARGASATALATALKWAPGQPVLIVLVAGVDDGTRGRERVVCHAEVADPRGVDDRDRAVSGTLVRTGRSWTRRRSQAGTGRG